MRAYSQDLRDKVIATYTYGKLNKSEISKIFNVCYDSIFKWIKRYESTGDYSSRQGKVGSPPLKFTDKQAVLDFISVNPDADGIRIRDAVCPELAMSTFYDALRRMEITFKKKSPDTNNEKNLNVKLLLKQWTK